MKKISELFTKYHSFFAVILFTIWVGLEYYDFMYLEKQLLTPNEAYGKSIIFVILYSVTKDALRKK